MNTPFEFIANLQYRLKAANAQVMAFQSGEAYIKLQEEHTKEIRLLERKITQLEKELSVSHIQATTNRNQWFEVFEDMENEYERKLDCSRHLNKVLEKRALEAERQLDDARNKIIEQRHEIYDLATQLEEEKGKNQEGSRVIKDTAERNRLQRKNPSYCRRPKKFLMTRILERHQKCL